MDDSDGRTPQRGCNFPGSAKRDGETKTPDMKHQIQDEAS